MEKHVMRKRAAAVQAAQRALEIGKFAQTDVSAIDMFRIRFEEIDEIRDQFRKCQDQIEDSLEKKDLIDELGVEEEKRDKFEDLIYEIKSLGCLLLREKTRTIESSPSRVSNIRLPKLSVPKFAGDIVSWTNFADLFKTIVHYNKDLSDIEKFQYLKLSLSEEPFSLIKNLLIDSRNYSLAWEILEKRYENRRLIATCHIEKMLALSNCNGQSLSSLKQFVNTIHENINALKVLKLPVDQWSFLMTVLFAKKLDKDTRRRWELSIEDSTAYPDFLDLLKFLDKQISVLEAMTDTVKEPIVQISGKPVAGYRTKHPSSSTFVQTCTIDTCCLCKDAHMIHQCQKFIKISPNERFKVAKQYNLCINCLRASHVVAQCPSSKYCRICHQRHHSMLHFNEKKIENPSLNSQITSDLTTTPPAEGAVSTYTSVTTPHSTVLLATAQVDIHDVFGNRQPIRVLLDSASQASYLTEACVKRLGLPRRKFHTSIYALGQVKVNTARGLVSCTISPCGQETTFMSSAIIVNRIAGNMPTASINIESFSHLKGLKLADPQFGTSSSVDMLIGAALFPHLLQEGRIFGHPGSPVALNTVFGWVLMGELRVPRDSPIQTFCLALDDTVEKSSFDIVLSRSLNSQVESESLNNILKRFWEVEDVASLPTLSNPEDIQSETDFRETVSRDVMGRYTVGLSFRTFPPNLGNSFVAASRCLSSLQRRLDANPAVKSDYINFMKDYLDSGHMTVVKNVTKNSPGFYMPHHCVLKPDSTSTKLRVVFNASKQSSNGFSLNDVLLTGPSLQQDIVAILMRVRFHKYVLTADIRQMYRQICIQPTHRPYQRILWSFDFSQDPEIFELNTVTYGMNCAPFLAIRTLKELASNEREKYPIAASVLDRDTYVDDIITGCNNLEDAVIVQKELSKLLAAGGFDLRKWCSNDPRVLENVQNDHKQLKDLNLDKDSYIKMLGLRWNPVDDYFFYVVRVTPRVCTKRSILSELAKIFDPLGWLSPLTMSAKLIIQVLWTLSLGWDDTPPEDVVQRWNLFQSQLLDLSSLRIPRYIPLHNLVDLIGFCDASQQGYAAVIYARTSISNDKPHVMNIYAKSRVAPLKRLSLPRLELLGALLLARLFKTVLCTLSSNVRDIVAFSDSTVALSWIQTSPHRWRTFVCNRTTEIQSVVPPHAWRHVRSSENPADCASRGLLPIDLIDHSLWWLGPTWLALPQNEWPGSTPIDTQISAETIESEAAKLTLLTQINESFSLLYRYSTLWKLQRVTSFIFRFFRRCRKLDVKNSSHLTIIELDHALLVWIKLEQHVAFSSEINAIRKNLQGARWFRKLSPFIDSTGIIRVGGRIRHASIAYTQKHPIILPARSRLTHLLIDHFHTCFAHPGPLALQAILSQRYWIVSARNVIRHRLSRCVKCFKCDPKASSPYMGDLPAARVTAVKPFKVVGVDFGGPFTISFSRARGVKTQKAYLCLFVCFATKALHLELTSDLSTVTFLAAFKRFIARRGRCTDIYSDCGTNFIGASRYLSELFTFVRSNEYNNAMSNVLAKEGIQWHINPPSIPHFGGLWESAIKSVKKHLVQVVGEQILTFEELTTVLTEIEALLNSRPLCPLSSDPNDLSALTPGHFLIQEAPVCLPEPNLTDLPLNRLSRWQLVQQLQQHFWNRWHKEYLNTLQQRAKWTTATEPLKKDALVLIKDENHPPLKWQLGRIVALKPGADGRIRVASVRTTNGEILRPIVKLCALPIESHN